jgi:hypothetical protein
VTDSCLETLLILFWSIYYLTGPQKFLLLTQQNEIRILSLSTEEHRDLELPIKNIGQVIAVDLDPVKKRVCWVDSQYHEIKCAYLNGSGKVSLYFLVYQ